MTERVSDEQISRDIAHAKAFRKTVDDTFMMPAGYPADLRDARATISRLVNERDSFAIAARDRGSDLLRSRATIAALRQQLAEAKTAAWIEGRDAAAQTAESMDELGFRPSTVAGRIRTLQPPPPSPVEAAAEPGTQVRS